MFQLNVCLSVQLLSHDGNTVGHHCFYCISLLLAVMMKREERDVKMSKLEHTDFSQNSANRCIKSRSPLGVFPACAAATFVFLSSWKRLRSEIFNSLTGVSHHRLKCFCWSRSSQR